MANSYYRGHPITTDLDVADGRWRYADDGTFIDGTERPCPKCGETATLDGPDPCLGRLPGVKAACCGHGVDEDGMCAPYVWFETGETLRGEDAVRRFAELRGAR